MIECGRIVSSALLSADPCTRMKFVVRCCEIQFRSQFAKPSNRILTHSNYQHSSTNLPALCLFRYTFLLDLTRAQVVRQTFLLHCLSGHPFGIPSFSQMDAPWSVSLAQQANSTPSNSSIRFTGRRNWRLFKDFSKESKRPSKVTSFQPLFSFGR